VGRKIRERIYDSSNLNQSLKLFLNSSFKHWPKEPEYKHNKIHFNVSGVDYEVYFSGQEEGLYFIAEIDAGQEVNRTMDREGLAKLLRYSLKAHDFLNSPEVLLSSESEGYSVNVRTRIKDIPIGESGHLSELLFRELKKRVLGTIHKYLLDSK